MKRSVLKVALGPYPREAELQGRVVGDSSPRQRFQTISVMVAKGFWGPQATQDGEQGSAHGYASKLVKYLLTD